MYFHPGFALSCSVFLVKAEDHFDLLLLSALVKVDKSNLRQNVGI